MQNMHKNLVPAPRNTVFCVAVSEKNWGGSPNRQQGIDSLLHGHRMLPHELFRISGDATYCRSRAFVRMHCRCVHMHGCYLSYLSLLLHVWVIMRMRCLCVYMVAICVIYHHYLSFIIVFIIFFMIMHYEEITIICILQVL